MRCLVTGAAGFIGSHLAERLLVDGHTVRAVDRFSPYYDVELKRRNVSGVERAGNLELFDQDLVSCDIPPLLEGVDVVFHLAAQPGVRVSWGEEFEIYLRDNVLASQRLLEAALQTSPERIVVASSSSIYGDAASYPVSEDDASLPRSPYGVTKAAVEALCRLYHKQFSVPVTCLRYFTVFGPRQRPDMAFNRFIRAALDGDPIRVFGDGSQSRDFTYVSDAVDATVAAGSRAVPGIVYNIAGGSHSTISEVIDTLAGLLDREIAVEYGEPVPGDVRDTHASIERARTASRLRAEGLARSGPRPAG